MKAISFWDLTQITILSLVDRMAGDLRKRTNDSGAGSWTAAQPSGDSGEQQDEELAGVACLRSVGSQEAPSGARTAGIFRTSTPVRHADASTPVAP